MDVFAAFWRSIAAYVLDTLVLRVPALAIDAALEGHQLDAPPP